MSWVTAIWAMLIGGCVAMALPHLLVGIWKRRGAHLFFVLAAAAVIWIAGAELALMEAGSVEQFARVQRWIHVPVFILFVALVSFVRLYLGTGRLWLGVTVCVIRFVSLVINFVFPPSLNFRALTGLRPLDFLGETVMAPVGVVSPWTHLAEVSSLLLFVYVADASAQLWRHGKRETRRRAIIVGGGISLFILAAVTVTSLTHRQIIVAPYFSSFAFVAILVAMAFELGFDLFYAGQFAQKLQASEASLQASEASLQESEERFRTMADAAPVLIWMSGQDKLCTFFNKAWLDFTGRTMEQEIGIGWTEGVHRDDFKRCFETYASAFEAREPFVMEYRLKHNDGAFRWITDKGVPRYGLDGNFRGYIGACADITDLLEKERALHRFKERVALAAEAAHLGVWELDAVTTAVWMSDKARELFQFAPGIPITHAMFQDRVHPEDRRLREATVQRAIETQGGYEIEYRILLPNGKIQWIAGRARSVKDEKGRMTKLLGVSMDVTERKQAQELFRLSTEASPSGILLVNDQRCILLVNTHIEELFGYQRDELLGRPVETLVPHRLTEMHAVLRGEFLATAEKRSMGRGRELFARRKDGTEFPVEIGLNPIQTPQGVLVLATVVDISARKLTEEEGRRRREKMSQLSRISLLGEMTASIAHEVNQPLSGIISNASAGQRFIDRGDLDPEKLREILTDIAADGRRAHDVVHNVRNTIKKGASFRKRIDVNEVVMDVMHMVQPDAQAHSCELNTLLAPGLPSIEGDPIQIQQVLINLMSNAFDAMRKTPANRRRVDISTEHNNEETIRLSVRDHGSGIPEEARERLFEQFFTTKEEGLGMGLAIVHSIVESHAGTIAAENVTDGGARFSCILPVSHRS